MKTKQTNPVKWSLWCAGGALGCALLLACAVNGRAGTVVNLTSNSPNITTNGVDGEGISVTWMSTEGTFNYHLVQEGPQGHYPFWDTYGGYTSTCNSNGTTNKDRSELELDTGCPNNRWYNCDFDFQPKFDFGQILNNGQTSEWFVIFQGHDYPDSDFSPSIAVTLTNGYDANHFDVYVGHNYVTGSGNNNSSTKIGTVSRGYWHHVHLGWILNSSTTHPTGTWTATLDSNGALSQTNIDMGNVHATGGVTPHNGIYRSPMNSYQVIYFENLVLTY